MTNPAPTSRTATTEEIPRIPGPRTATTSPFSVPGTVTAHRTPAPSGLNKVAITGSSAQFQGVGTINGCGRYLVAGTATQGVAPATDTFEVHIWDASHSFDAPLLLVTGTLSTGQIKIVR